MAVKSILEVDVNDASFRQFQRLYNQYQSSLRSMPAAWKAVNAQIDGSRASFDKMVGRMAAANVQARLAAKAQERADYLTRTTAERWSLIARSTMSFASSLRDVTVSVMKMAGITGIVTGLVGGGGLWGIESDSGEEYVREVAAEEYGDLRKILTSIGVPTSQLPTEFDPKWTRRGPRRWQDAIEDAREAKDLDFTIEDVSILERRL